MNHTEDNELPFVTARHWVDIVSRIRLGTAIPVRNRKPTKSNPEGKPVTVSGRMVKAIAFRLAWWADGHDGTRVYPGPARLAVVSEVDYKTVKYAYAVLRRLGLLTQVAYARGPQGAREHHADEYRLTIPPDLLDRVTVLDPLELEREIESIRALNRGTRKNVAGSADPRNWLGLEGSGIPPTHGADNGVAGVGNPAQTELEGAGTPNWGESESRIPTSYQTTNKDTNQDHLPAQLPTAREDHEPISINGGEASDAPSPCPKCRGALEPDGYCLRCRVVMIHAS